MSGIIGLVWFFVLFSQTGFFFFFFSFLVISEDGY